MNLGDIMWWNIIKNKLTTTATSGSFDFEEEEIPEKDEPNCKEKLMAIQDALIDFRPAGTKYKGAKHSRGSEVMQTYIYQEKPYDETKGDKLGPQWAYAGNASGMIIHSNRQAVRELTNEEACQVLEDLKLIIPTSAQGTIRGKLTIMSTNLDTGGAFEQFSNIISINLKRDDYEPIYKIYIGKQDRDFARDAFFEILRFLRQQVK